MARKKLRVKLRILNKRQLRAVYEAELISYTNDPAVRAGLPAGWKLIPRVDPETMEPSLSVSVPMHINKRAWRDAYAGVSNLLELMNAWRTERQSEARLETLLLANAIPTDKERAAYWMRATGAKVTDEAMKKRRSRARNQWRSENPIDRIEYSVDGRNFPLTKLECVESGWKITFARSVRTSPKDGGQVIVHLSRGMTRTRRGQTGARDVPKRL